MGKSISFLLGAGFSAPIGFPIGNKLSGMIVKKCRQEAQITRNKYARLLEYMINNHIEFFKKFDYEDFFDRIECYYKKEDANYLWAQFGISNELKGLKDYYQYTIFKLLNKIPIYNGESVYDSFLKSLCCLVNKNDEINIHSLNHDLLFESFGMSSLIGDEICDGYEKENSIYKENGKFKIPYYSGIYNKKIRLYKLHGSIDQYKYFNQSGDVSIYVKIDNSSYHDDIHKYSKMGEQIDTYIPANTEPRFLTGDIMKTKSLREDYFEKLMTRFEENLEQSDYLIIIGYGAKDKEINKRIKTHFDYKNKPCYIWDLNPGGVLKKFAAEINALPIIEDSVTNFKLPTAINC